jgi:hypothetical protein
MHRTTLWKKTQKQLKTDRRKETVNSFLISVIFKMSYHTVTDIFLIVMIKITIDTLSYIYVKS